MISSPNEIEPITENEAEINSSPNNRNDNKKPIIEEPSNVDKTNEETENVLLIEPIEVTEETKINTPSKPTSAVSKRGEVYNPQTHVDLNGQIFEKDKNIHYKETVEFVPNYAILMYKSDFDTKLTDLVHFLREYPEKKVVVFGNGGYENHNKFDDLFDDGRLTQFGSGTNVYNQVFRYLGNSKAEEIKRIEEEGYPMIEEKNGEISQQKRNRNEVDTFMLRNGNYGIATSGKVGHILQARANKIKDYLISKGIDKNRIIAKKGKFVDREYHDVNIYVK